MSQTQHLYFLDTFVLNPFNLEIGNEININVLLYRYSKKHYL